MMSLRIGQRLALGYGLVILLLVATTLVAIARLRGLSATASAVLDRQYPISQTSHLLTHELERIARAMRSILLLKDDAVTAQQLGEIGAATQRVEAARRTLRELVRDDAGRGLLDEIDVVHSAYIVNQDDFIHLLGEHRIGEARNLLVVDLHGYQQNYFQLLDRLRSAQEAAMSRAREEVAGSHREARLWLLGFAGLAVLLSVGITLRVTRYLLRKLGGEPDYAAEIARQIAVGDLAPRIELAPGDRGSLLFAMSAMRDALAERDGALRAANEELARHLEMLRHTQDDLVRSEKIAALGHLVAGVAHELNTPIGNCLLAASTLKEEARDFERCLVQGLTKSRVQAHREQLQQSTELLLRNLDRAGELVTSFKRLAVDKQGEQGERFELAPLVRQACAEACAQWRRPGLELQQQVPDGLFLISHAVPLAQVISQLVGNAFVHGLAGRTRGQVQVRASLNNEGSLVVVVEDDGVGLSPEQLQHVFEPFFTARLGSGGSGLGLHLCFNIVTGLLGGRIHLESAPGAGCRAVLSLPPASLDRS